MKILITGGTGFQGSNLSKSLLKDGHEVVILNLHSDKNETNVKRFGLEKAYKMWGSINDIRTDLMYLLYMFLLVRFMVIKMKIY